MCIQTTADNDRFGRIDNQIKLLLQLQPYHAKDKESGGSKPIRPSRLSSLVTSMIIVLFFTLLEQICRYLIYTYLKDVHSIFENERNRHVLARHIGVDAVASGIVSYLGYRNRRHLSDVHNIGRDSITFAFSKSNSNTKERKGASKRIYDYVPEGHHLLVFFIAYQIKNMYDTIVWNDGALFVFHHLLFPHFIRQFRQFSIS